MAAVIDRLLTIDLPAAREIIVVNDGSSDGTREVLDGLPANPRLHIVHAERNRGKGHAIRLGLGSARGDVVAIQDADLELDPAQLAMLVAPLLAGETDVVYGSRFLGGTPDAPRLTVIANRTLTSLTNLLFGSAHHRHGDLLQGDARRRWRAASASPPIASTSSPRSPRACSRPATPSSSGR